MHIGSLDKDVALPSLRGPRELHLSQRPSLTAQWVALGRALELTRPFAQRIVSDPFAPAFLSPSSRLTLRLLAGGTPVVRAAEREAPGGLSTYVLCRHRYLDGQLQTALSEGVEQVLLLGAGYDSRAYRFGEELQGRPVHEVDLPPLSRRKAAIVAAHPELFGPTRVRRVEVDFRTESLAQRLLQSGFAVGARTFVAWEGVAPYLTGDAVGTTLETLHGLCGAGSVVAMDLWDGSGGTGRWAPARRFGARAARLIGEPITFGLRPDTAGDFLAAFGFERVEQLTGRQLADRYATDGRSATDSLYVLSARI